MSDMKQRIIVGCVWGILSIPGVSYAQQLGGSEHWPEVLGALYKEVQASHQALQSQHPDAKLPKELAGWLENFVSTPFAHGGHQQDLQTLSQQLQSTYSSDMLSDKDAALLNNFVRIVQNLSSDLTGNISGAQSPDRGQQAALVDGLTRVHDRDQQWVNTQGQALADKLKQLDFQGAQGLLQQLIQEMNAKRTQ